VAAAAAAAAPVVRASAAAGVAPRSLADLDAALARASYVGGFAPSRADREAFAALAGSAQLTEAAAAAAPNAARWARHMLSFPAEERERWS